MRRKGSLNLSINAIVVLIMAITMLGLGLAFINNMFGGTTKKLDTLVSGLDENVKEQLAQSVDRITLTSTTIEVQKGKETKLFFAIRNDLDVPVRARFDLENAVYCDAAIDNTISNDLMLDGSTCTTGCEKISFIDFQTYPDRVLDKGESSVMPLIIKPKSSAKNSVYSCHIDLCVPTDENDPTYPLAMNGPVTKRCTNSATQSSYQQLDFDLIVR